jgi:hypothetical protein
MVHAFLDLAHKFQYVHKYSTINILPKSRDSSVGKSGYRLDDRGSRFRFPVGAGNSFLHHRVQIGSGSHPASYPICTGAISLGVIAAGA